MAPPGMEENELTSYKASSKSKLWLLPRKRKLKD